jgi:hypothetical protein
MLADAIKAGNPKGARGYCEPTRSDAVIHRVVAGGKADLAKATAIPKMLRKTALLACVEIRRAN